MCSAEVFTTFSYITSLSQPITFSADDASLNRPFLISTPQKSTRNPVNFDSSVGNSIRDCTLDILSIVSTLLFGVGCSALTAAFIYLVWYICWPGFFISVLMNLMRRMTVMLQLPRGNWVMSLLRLMLLLPLNKLSRVVIVLFAVVCGR